MARQPTAGRAGRGGGGRGGHGGRFPKRNEAPAPRKTGEVGACKDLEGNVFTIGSGNKGKDGDLLRTVRLRSPTLTTHGVRGKEKSEPRVLRVSTYISNTPPRFHMAKPNGNGKREWTERPKRT
jgi:hypothetical protein